MLRFFAFLCAAQLAVACPALAEPMKAPSLGAAINLSQGVQPGLVEQARALGLLHLRDGMNWGRVERAEGVYSFEGPRTRFPDTIGQTGSAVTIVTNWGNPIYDNGDTPYSPHALRALSDYVAALTGRFPAIDGIEVGNEFNGVNFVRGPLRKMTSTERARAYVPMLRAASKGAKAARPDLRVLGGATHSLPGGYLWQIMDDGGADYMDALAVHPYTTLAEQFVRQMAVLRRHPVLAQLPVEVTEFGTPGAGRAPAHMLRNYCQFALGGVTRAIWFPGNLRGEKMAPLFTPKGLVTPAGRAFQLISGRMAERSVMDASDDAFTYGCQFGNDVMVLWGAPRAVKLADGVVALDATGARIAAPAILDPVAPVVLISDQSPISEAVMLGPQVLVADSFYQFAYPEEDETLVKGDGFERFARKGQKTIPLRTLPGQERSGVPWFPYRGHPDHRDIRLTADSLLPGGDKDIVHRYTSPSAQILHLRARFAPGERSEDGVKVVVYVGGTERLVAEATAEVPLEIDLPDLALTSGDVIEIAVSDNGTPKGDVTEYRISLSHK